MSRSSGGDDTELALDQTAATPATPGTVADDARPADRDGGVLPVVAAARYRIDGEVGRGGLGRVLRARDQVLDREVALKELHGDDPAAQRRFVREALITARLQHPAIVPLYEAGRWRDRAPFYAMKLVAGRSLADAIAAAATLEARLALLPSVLAVADAIAYAHRERIIHRDLKPSNVVVGDFGETVVIDWGLAKDLAIDDRDAGDAGPYRATATGQTMVGAVLGTPAFMAPEQARGDEVDERADVYALGAILYDVIAGRGPHEGKSVDEMIEKILRGDVVPIEEREPRVPADLAALVGKAMARDPAARYPSARELAEDLRRFQTGQLVGAHEYSTWALVRRWIARHRAAVAVSAAAAVILAVVGAIAIERVVAARNEAEAQRNDATAARKVAEDSKATAVVERDTARATADELLVEEGRRELLAGRPLRALPYLSRAYTDGLDTAPLRFLLAQAMRPLDAQVATLVGHQGEVTAAAFTPDGALIATGGADGVARIWSAKDGALVRALDGQKQIARLAISPDGTRLATGGADEVVVRDVATGAIRFRAPIEGKGKFGDVTVVAFSPDGARLLVCTLDGAAVIYDAATGAARRLADEDAINFAAFSPDGRLVGMQGGAGVDVFEVATGRTLRRLTRDAWSPWGVAFDAHGTFAITANMHDAVVWNVATGAVVRVLPSPTGNVGGVELDPSGRLLVMRSGAAVQVWDLDKGELVRTLTSGADLLGAKLSPDGARILTWAQDETATVWDVATGLPVLVCAGHRGGILDARFSSDGRRVVTASEDATAKIWDVGASGVVASFAGTGAHDGTGTHAIAIDADGPHVRALIAHASPPGVSVLDLESGKTIAELGEPNSPATGDLVRGGTLAVIDKHVWNADTGALVADYGSEGNPVLSPDGKRAVTTNWDPVAKLWDVEHGTLIATLSLHTKPVYAASWSHDGTRFVTHGDDDAVGIWDGATGKNVGALRGYQGDVQWAEFSDDDALIITTGWKEQTVRLWDARTGAQRLALAGARGGVLSHDKKLIVAATAYKEAAVFDAATGAVRAALEGHRDWVGSIELDRTDGMILTGGGDASVALWDASSGALLARFPTTAWVLDARWTPDGRRIATRSEDGSADLRDISPETRAPADIAARVARGVPWQLDGDHLVPTPRPAAMGTSAKVR